MNVGIIGAFGIIRENDSGRMVEFCAERGLCMDNIYFDHKFA